MNVYLGSTELNDALKQSTELEGIYLGSNKVWEPTPSTVRIFLTSEYDDGTAAPCGRRIDSNSNLINYIDVPPCPGVATNYAYPSSVLGYAGGGIWFINGDVGALYYVYPEYEQSFITSAKYYRSGADWSLNLTTTSGQPVTPTGGVQDGDTIALLFSSAPTYSLETYSQSSHLLDRLLVYGQRYVDNNVSIYSPDAYNYIIQGSDGYSYGLVTYTVNWSTPILYAFKVETNHSGIINFASTGYSDWGGSNVNNLFKLGDDTAMAYIEPYVSLGTTNISELGDYLHTLLSS